VIIIKLTEIIDYLFEKYKENNDFANFINDTKLIERIIQPFRGKKNNSLKNTNNFKIDTKLQPIERHEKPVENEISNSDGFSKIIFEDLKMKRAFSEDKIAQEYLLNRKDIRECFSYLAKNFNNVQLHQGKTWVIEYTGGL